MEQNDFPLVKLRCGSASHLEDIDRGGNQAVSVNKSPA